MPVPPQALGSSECHHQLGTLGEGLRVLGAPAEQQRQVWTLPALSLGLNKEDGAALSPAALAGLSDSQGAAARPGVPCISEGTAAGTRWKWGGQARLIASGQVAARSSLDMCHGTGTNGSQWDDPAQQPSHEVCQGQGHRFQALPYVHRAGVPTRCPPPPCSDTNQGQARCFLEKVLLSIAIY